MEAGEAAKKAFAFSERLELHLRDACGAEMAASAKRGCDPVRRQLLESLGDRDFVRHRLRILCVSIRRQARFSPSTIEMSSPSLPIA